MATDRQYTGQRNEIGLGLYDYNARYYDPLLGRFLSADSIVPSPANPQSLNRYSYVLNSPLRYTDPSGHAHWVGEDGDTVPRVYTNPQQRQTLQGNSTLSAAATLGSSTLQSVSTPTSYRANQSSNGYYWTTPSKLPNDAGVIMRYQTHFEAVPKVATVYAPCIQGPELQTVWRYESGQWTRSQEVHFAMSVDAGIFSVGTDSYGGTTSPELGVGPVVWGGNDLMVEGKILGSGVEAGVEYGGAGDFYVITTGEKLNRMGSNGIQQHYVQRDSVLLGYEVYESYDKAWNVFWPRNLAQQRWTGFPYTWRSTEME